MGESLVRFGHAVHIFLLLHCAAARVGRVDQFIRQPVDHGLAGTFTRILQKPANGQRLPAERIHFHGNLIVRAAHATGLYFQQRLHVLDGLLEKFQRVVVAFLGHLVHGAVKHALRGGLLAFPHHRADELLDEIAAINRVSGLCATADDSFAWHVSRFAPKILLLTSGQPWAASLHTWSGLACDSQHPRHPAFRARCDSALPGDPSRGHRVPARSSAPASCARCREYKWSLPLSWSNARALLCARRSSVSSASAYTRECIRRAFPDSPSKRVTSF